MIITRNLRTSALVCRADVMRQTERRHYAVDPYTGELVNRATGYPSPQSHDGSWLR